MTGREDKIWKSEEYFTTPERQLLLLDDALETNDASHIANVLRIILKVRLANHSEDDSVELLTEQMARLADNVDPNLSVVLDVLGALGMRLSVMEASPKALAKPSNDGEL